jgi:hypothetical protein
MTLQPAPIDAHAAHRPGAYPSASIQAAAANSEQTATSHRARRRFAIDHAPAGDAHHANITAPKLAANAIEPVIAPPMDMDGISAATRQRVDLADRNDKCK